MIQLIQLEKKFLFENIPSFDIKSFSSLINSSDLSFECVNMPTFENTFVPSSLSRFMLEYGNGTLSVAIIQKRFM